MAWANRPTTWGRQHLWRRRAGFLNQSAANDDDITCPIRFIGQFHDPESGLHYNRHRYYDPDTGQYLSPDPLGLDGGFRPQGYVKNPNGWIDPLGLIECSQGFLYRGISAKHPAIEDAKLGIVKPGNPHGTLTPEQHAEGGLTGESQYVSWTPDKNLALSHANKDGPGGVLLCAPQGPPPPDATWSWGWTHQNEWGEIEMLQEGSRFDAQVISLGGS